MRVLERLRLVAGVIVLLLCSAFLVYIIASAFTHIPGFLSNLPNRLQSDSALFHKLYVFAVLAFSILFFLFRKHLRAEYGYLEVLVGLGLVSSYFPAEYTKLVETASQFSMAVEYRTKLLSLLGGIYVIVRGLDNIDQGVKQWDEKFAKQEESKQAAEAKGETIKVGLLQRAISYYRHWVRDRWRVISFVDWP
jgi:hypothetical protein